MGAGMAGKFAMGCSGNGGKMKQRKSNMILWRRVVSMLLAAAMILTAAPQTGLTVLAVGAEDSDGSARMQTVSVEDDTAGSDVANDGETDQNVDNGSGTNQNPGSGDGTNQNPGSGDGTNQNPDNGDGTNQNPGNGDGTNQNPGNGDGTDQNVDTGDGAGNTEDPGQGENPDAAEDTENGAAEESVSENDLNVKLTAAENQPKEAPAAEDGYQGEVKGETNENGAYERLIISAAEAGGEQAVLKILQARAEETERFECVELQMQDKGANSRKIKKNLLNAAIAVLKTEGAEGETPNYWIDYNFTNETTGEWRNFTLDQPRTAGADINANVTVAPVAGQGVKLKFPAVNFPAENVNLRLGGSAWENGFAESLAGAGDDPASEEDGWQYGRYSMFTLASGKPAVYEEEGSRNARYNEAERQLEIDVLQMKANMDYLMAPVANDDAAMNAGDTKVLTAPVAGATNVAWKSYTEDIVSISTTGKGAAAKTELSAWDEGEVLYGVTYKEGSAVKAKFWRMRVNRALSSMRFLEADVALDQGESKYLQLSYYPSDAGCNQENQEEIQWEITEGSGSVIKFGFYDENGDEHDQTSAPTGNIMAVGPGTATVKATYVPSKNEETPITATCEVTVSGKIGWENVETEVEGMHLYAVSGIDTKLGNVTLPAGWTWVDSGMPLAPFAGTDGHEFTAVCERDGKSGRFGLYVRMINLKGIVMTSEQPTDGQESVKEWADWIPDSLAENDELKLSFDYELDNLDSEHDGEEDAVRQKLADKYDVVWGSTPANLLQEVKDENDVSDPMTRTYTAAITGNKKQAQKKTFTVSLKDKTAKGKPVAFKASHTLTVTTKDLIDLDQLIDTEIEGGNPQEEYNDAGKLIKLTFTVNQPLVDYNKQKLTFASMDPSILQLAAANKITAKEESVGEGEEQTAVTKVTIPCTQKNTGRVWIKVTAPDEMKSSRSFCVELPDRQPKILGAAQTINKASVEHTVPVYLSTHEQFPLAKDESDNIQVSITEVKANGKGKDLKNAFELTNITDSPELNRQEVATLLAETGGAGEPYIGVYSMKLGLTDAKLKAGTYTVKLACPVQERNAAGEEPIQQTVSLTVKVADAKPKVAFQQTGKVNLFYTDDEGAGTLQINTNETVTSVTLKDFVDAKKPKNNRDCHYEVRQKAIEDGENGGETQYEENVYEIVRKKGDDAGNVISGFDKTLKKGILEYEVAGYDGTFQTVFTVTTEEKAPAIALSAKSETLYPGVWYTDSWISMSYKATGEMFVPNDAKYFATVKGVKQYTPLTIGAFDHENPESDEQIAKEAKITGGASGNGYRLFVTDDGSIVSRLRDPNSNKRNSQKQDTMNLELKMNNWSKPVSVSYKLQVDNSLKPKLTFGKGTLLLNKNDAVYRGQQARTTLRLKGCGNQVMQDNDNWVTITGQDEKSKRELKGKESSLVVQYWRDEGDIVVRFNDNDIRPDTYKFKISVGNNEVGMYASAVLNVKVVEKNVKQSLNVAQKGSIDVLNREGTSIVYTPKISNLTGTVTDGWLRGRDADLFENWFEDGKLIVKARGGQKYSTKNTYQFYAVFRVENEDWHGYTIRSDTDGRKPFQIKVKQGKPTLKATANGNTIYRQRDNRVNIRIEAMLGKQEVEIEDVWLVNYTDDLQLEQITMQENGDSWEQNYDPETKSVKLALQDSWGSRDIRKNGTYKVKFAVRYCDKAGDVKEAEVTCPIVIK